jgi:hypothetical protein
MKNPFRKKKEPVEAKEPKIPVDRNELLDQYYLLLVAHQECWNDMFRQQQQLEPRRDRSYVR